jgi:hypothetical protein
VALTVKRILLWRVVIPNRPGALAEVLAPLAAVGTDLQVVMGYREAGRSEAVVELVPVQGRKLAEAAEGAGLTPSTLPVLLLSGGNRAGLGHKMARALADAGINLSFLMAQTVGRKYSAVLGFESDADAKKAATLIRRAAA